MAIAPVPTLLIASADPLLLRSFEVALREFEAQPRVALTIEDTVKALEAPRPPDLVILDVRLMDMGDDSLLWTTQEHLMRRRIPVLLLAEGVPQHWLDRLDRGLEVDLLPLNSDPAYTRLRINKALSASVAQQVTEALQDRIAMDSERDPVTGAYNRAGVLSRFFSETDRAHRMNTPLCVIQFEIDDFDHWTDLFGKSAGDELLALVAGRIRGMLRSYDLLGRLGLCEFLILLPGCSTEGAVQLAERIRTNVFTDPFRIEGGAVRLTACFSVASSEGRAPVVILHELEEALAIAQDAGPETIECAEGCPPASPVSFLTPTMRTDLQTW